jgi:Uma2 family endonuclease
MRLIGEVTMTAIQHPANLAAEPLPIGERFTLHDVSWSFYEAFLREMGDRPIRTTYDDGSLEMMAPLAEHEHSKRLIGRLIETLTFLRKVPIASCGSTTLRREDLRQGLEPDECYYIQNEPAVRNKKNLSLDEDPPPDLVVEVDITHQALNRKKIYAAMGVPEVWRFDGGSLHCLHLQGGGTYASQFHSRAFPWLAIAEVERFVKMLWTRDETSIVWAFADWLRDEAPRG